MSQFSFFVISSVLLCSGCGFRIETGSDTTPTIPTIHSAVSTYDGSPSVFRWANEFQTSEAAGDLRTLIDDVDILESLDLDQLPDFMTPSDHALIQKTAKEWLDSNGLIAQKHLTPKGNLIRQETLAQMVGVDSLPHDLRRELNRALLLLGSPYSRVAQNPDNVALVQKAIGLIIRENSEGGYISLMQAKVILDNVR